MTPVYIAEGELDAQLVLDLLLGAGIGARIFGPNVAGADGEPPATRQVRVVVEDAEADEARRLVQDWQTGPELADDDDLDPLLDSQALDFDEDEPVVISLDSLRPH